MHRKGGFIRNVYRTYINGVLWERNTINRTKNSFPRVRMKKIRTDSQYSKRRENCCRIEHYIKTFQNSKILGLCNNVKIFKVSLFGLRVHYDGRKHQHITASWSYDVCFVKPAARFLQSCHSRRHPSQSDRQPRVKHLR